jgi:hypothetical protein
MIVSNRVIKIFQEVISYSSDKDKILELAKILGINWSEKTIKINTTKFFNKIRKNKHIDYEKSRQILEWCESYVYHYSNHNNDKIIATGNYKGKVKSSIVEYRIINVLFDEFYNNIEFDNIGQVSFQTISGIGVQDAKAN